MPCTSSDTCHDGSTCDPVGSESFFRCVCPPGRTGVRCDVDAGNNLKLYYKYWSDPEYKLIIMVY